MNDQADKTQLTPVCFGVKIWAHPPVDLGKLPGKGVPHAHR